MNALATDIDERLAQGDVELGSFTEEELALISAPDPGQRLVPLSRVDALEPGARRTVLAAAFRSLAARGLASAVQDSGVVDVRVFGVLATVADVRRRPSLVAIVDRVRGGKTDHRYVYGVGRGAVMEERVDGSGTHLFTLRSVPRQAVELASFCDPYGQAGRTAKGVVRDAGEPTAEWQAVEHELEGLDVGTRVYAVRWVDDEHVDEVGLGVGAGADGVWLLSGTPATPTSAARQMARMVSRRTLVDRLRACLTLETSAAVA